MRIVFWQNCMSPHQIPYIVQLLDDERVDEVVLVAGETVSETRKAMGWNVTEFQGLDQCKVYIRPHGLIIESLMEARQADSYHLFSGIRADAFVFQCLRKSLSYKVKRYIITEPPYTYDKPLWMHYMRFYLQDYRFVRFIDGVFAIGESCAKYYRSLSKRWKVFPFIYVTNFDKVPVSVVQGDMRLVYVGSLSKRKNVGVLLESLLGIQSVKLSIFGDGSERKELEFFARKHCLNVKFEGNIDMKDVQSEMSKYDVLVLPSLHDGWGAVVNEALAQGLYVVCSDKCGAMALLHDQERGSVFKSGDSGDLRQLLTYCAKNVEEIRAGRMERKQWAINHISGEAVARYFVDSLSKDDVKSLF